MLDIHQQRQALLEAEGLDPRLPALGEQAMADSLRACSFSIVWCSMGNLSDNTAHVAVLAGTAVDGIG